MEDESPAIGHAMMWAAGAAMLWGFALFVMHLYAWLKFGEWQSYPAFALLLDLDLSPPRFEWVGIQKGANWLLTLPAAGLLWWLGMGMFWIGSATADGCEERNRIRRRNLPRE